MGENLKNSMISTKVIHLSTSHSGGAGIAARRLSLALNRYGINSIFVALERDGYLANNKEIAITRSLQKKMFSFLNSLFSKLFINRTYFTFFSMAPLTYRMVEKFGSPQTTIIHIHNWFNLINLRVMQKLLINGYQLIFTLHDQRLFTGGCHYSLECERFTSNCSKCPLLPKPFKILTKWNLNRQQKIFLQYADQITIIAPSKWIEKQAAKSRILKKCKIVYSPNVHDSKELTRASTLQTRLKKNNKKLSLGVASIDIKSPLKGGDILPSLMQLINENNLAVDIKFLIDYKSNPNTFWEEIDYLLVVSRQDNSPNVIHESKSFGIPIIGTNVGGIPELLNRDYDFIINFDSEILNQILFIINNLVTTSMHTSSQKIRDDYNNFSLNSLSDITKIYKSRLNIN
jgi:glycosyltransferase involved in cell wall biosynthesis